MGSNGRVEKVARRSTVDPLLTGGTALFLAGAAMLADDIHDFGDFSRPDHPLPFHHWQYGAICIVSSIPFIQLGLVKQLKKLYKTPKEK